MIRSLSELIRAGAFSGLLWCGMHAQAADVTSYWVRKGAQFDQTSAAAPTPNQFQPVAFVARVSGDASAINGVDISTPSDIFPSFPLDNTGDRFEYSIAFGEAEVNAFFPAGEYAFDFHTLNQGDVTAKVNLTEGTFPAPVPQVLNYPAAQAVNPANAFSLNFSPYTGAGAGDVFEFELVDDSGAIVFETSGTGTSATIPAATLEEGRSYVARLRFVHNVDVNTTAYPGASGSAGYYKETQFSLETTGEGGGGDDTTPPELVFSNPGNAATDVAVNTPILFVFSEPMARQQAIQWGANVNPANFTYSWGTGDQMLTASYSGSLPANTTITWILTGGATGFKDRAGNALPAGFQGSFTTGTGSGGGTNDPCTSTNQAPAGAGYGSVFKSVDFVQTDNSAPVPDTENPASAFATYSAATNQTVTAVRVTGPNGIDLSLQNTFGTFLVFQDFPSGAAMDTALPPGNYTITATGAGSGTLALPSASTVPVPRILNLVELKAFDPTKDFVLNFSPFTGAGQSDSIFISLNGPSGRHFNAPDFCLNRQLPNTATSVTIPANTFLAGDQLNGTISFTTMSFNTNAIPNTSLTAAATAQTSFEFTTGGGSTTNQIRWTSSVLNANGTAAFTVQAPAGTNLVVEASTNLTQWSQVSALPTTNGSAVFSTNATTPRYRFFRARAQ